METSVPPPKGPQQATAASLRTPYGIGDLPPEVLLNIFQCFSVQELDYTISPVCRLWHDLSQRPCLRLELTLKYEVLDTASACDLLRSCPNLKDLSIIRRGDVHKLLHHVALYNHDLRRLAVNEWSGWPILSEEALDEILICCPKIVDLTIKTYQLQSNKFFRDLGVRLPELRKINVNETSPFGPDELRMIVGCCGNLEEIRAVTLSLPLCDEDIFFVAETLCGTLKVLEIYGTHLTVEGFAALGQCYQLRKFYIRNACKITDNGVFHLTLLQKLDDLQLSGLKMVSPYGWVKMFSESRWRQMKNLSLVDCANVNDDTLQQVATACPNLVTLNLEWCKHFTNEGLRSVLQKCTDLEHLNIRETQKYVFRIFSFISIYTRKLKSLLYTEFGVEEEKNLIIHLRDTMPELKIRPHKPFQYFRF